MPAFLVPLHEFNPCHTPGGPGGGQFCSTHDAFVPMPPRRPLPFTRRRVPTSQINDLWAARLYMTPAEKGAWEQLRKGIMRANEALMAVERAADQRVQAGTKQPEPEVEAARAKFNDLAEQMRVIEKQAARRVIGAVAKELDFPPDRITIVDDPHPREFVVGGRRWNEGGHFNPQTGQIQINIHTSRGVGLVDMVAHEIAHAKFEVWQSAMSAESERLNSWKPEGVEQTRSGMFIRASGAVYPQFLAAFKREFPAHAAVMGTYGSYYVKEPDRVHQQMIEDDGFTDYSKAYWTEAVAASSSGRYWQYKSFTGRQRTGTPFERAIDETLAEVAGWRVSRRLGLIAAAEKVPTKPWRKFSAQINQFYRAHGQT
jgi:hypothetical protein